MTDSNGYKEIQNRILTIKIKVNQNPHPPYLETATNSEIRQHK